MVIISNIVEYWNNEASIFDRKDELENGLLLNLRNKIVLKVDGWNEGIRRGVFDLRDYDYEKFIIVDISDIVLKRARSKHKDISFVISDIKKLPIRMESIDFILDISTSDHLHFNYFNNIIKGYVWTLRKGGEIVIIFNKYNLFGKVIVKLRRIIKYREVNKQFRNSYWFKVKEVITILKRYFIILMELEYGPELMSTYRKPFFLPPHNFYMSYLMWCIKHDK